MEDVLSLRASHTSLLQRLWLEVLLFQNQVLPTFVNPKFIPRAPVQAKVGQGTPAKVAAEALPKAWNSVPKVEVAPIPPRPPPVQRSKQQYTT